MRKVLLSTVAFALIVMVAGCATLPMESDLEKPVSMTKMTDTPAKSFSSSYRALWLFWGAISLSLPTVDGVIVPEMGDHNGVQNLKITTHNDALDFIVTMLTDGILTMRTVTIEGEVYD